ncbi:MAG: hypothetical protein ACK5KR_05565 [Breznakia sp.]
MIEDIVKKEEKLQRRLKKLKELEVEIKKKEKALKNSETVKKQVLLRLSSSLWKEIANWADEDFRSINAQVEYLLTESVKKRHNK